MRLNRHGKLVRTDMWREGKYLDLWSVPHFLSGIMVALALFLVGLEALSAFVISFLLLVGYEMFEVIVKIDETRWNRVLDVVVGMVSFAPAFILAPTLARGWVIGAFVVVTIVDGALSFLGWHESQKAAVLEAKLRAEIEKEREKFIRRRSALAARWKRRRTARGGEYPL